MTRIKMRIVVEVEITGTDAHHAFQLLDDVKYNLERVKLLSECKIKRVATDAMLSEEVSND